MIWFKFYTAWRDYIRELSDAEAGRFLKALLDFEETGETQSLSGAERIMYNIASKQLKQDAEHSAEVSKKRSEAGRGSRKNQMLTNDNNCYQLPTNADNSENSEQLQTNAEQIKELRIKNKELRVKNNIAKTDVSASQNAKQQNLKPDDHDFWKFAKDNSELAETFYKATGIYPVKSQFGRWVNDCKDLAEAEINVDRLQKTIAYMQSENIPLSAPGSCLKTAQWLKSRGGVPVKSTRQSQQKPKYNAFELLAMRENGIPVPEYDIEVSA